MINMKQGDCMDLMRETPDGAFDLAIVDPPYGWGDLKRATDDTQRYTEHARQGTLFDPKPGQVQLL